jgi:peptidoglycan/LPS O-acetylase OafA/YrhL
MNTSTAATSTFAVAPGKSHYDVLDGLRGVASLLVVLFHILETFSNNDPTKQIINHGYLAVDFFFLLSGFVIAYAYDERRTACSRFITHYIVATESNTTNADLNAESLRNDTRVTEDLWGA